MFAPKLYTVYKIPLGDIVEANYNIGENSDLNRYKIRQQDGGLLRQIRLITNTDDFFNPYIIFVNIDKKNKDTIRKIVINGFTINGRRFVISERSASMTRNGILSFVDEEIEPELNRRITMDVNLGKTVISKWYAYRGLLLSACHNLEGYFPKMIVVPDYMRVIPEQRIKYVYDETTDFIDKDGNQREWTQKNITEGIRDITINVFDGCGLCHPDICREIERRLGSSTRISSMILRAPFIKGVLHEMDYPSFFSECGVSTITDIWGVEHDAAEPMMILTESMYKGFKYFKHYGDSRDWEVYWEKFRQYDHCIGVAKWNFTVDEEPVYTRGNYQILQDLELPYDKFRSLANDSIDWADKIVHGDLLYTYCFLGLYADKHNPKNDYTAAIMKNPEMIKEPTVKKYLLNLLNKYKNDMKCGKLWLKATFKFMAPDLIMLLEHIGGLEPVGSLESDEFYSFSKNGVYDGEFLIERNPHICKSEHVILNGVHNDVIDKYCGHLANVCMINGKSITPQKLNGSDWDGDLCLLIDNKTMMNGVDRNVATVLDIEDKITAKEEEDTLENRVELILRTINSLIGETSNCATGYYGKNPKSKEVKEKYERYIDLLSVINGKVIDYAKTGVLFNIPKHIAKYSKPLPYFMKYASEYYGGLNKFSHANTNMNRLCKDIEHWCKHSRYAGIGNDFDYTIMIDNSLPVDDELQSQINELYLKFCNEMVSLQHDQLNVRKYGDPSLSQYNARNFTINWGYYYELYKQECEKLCSDVKQLANAAVRTCYEVYPTKRNTKFMWVVAGKGILSNLEQQIFKLPVKDCAGEYTYLGNRYTFKEIALKGDND